MKAERKKIIELLNNSDYDGVVAVAHEGAPVFRILLGLSYDKETLLCWRSVQAVGHLAAALAPDDPATVRNMVRRLVWTLSDECGGMAWSAPEMLAEIAARNPVLCGDIPLIVVHLDEAPFRFGATWAAGRLADSHPADALTAVPELTEAMDHRDPFVRGAASWALGRLRVKQAQRVLERHSADEGAFSLYFDGRLHPYTVGEAARKALGIILRD